MSTPTELLAEFAAAAPAVPLEEVPAMIGRLEELKAALWIRASSPAAAANPPPRPAGEDRLLTVQEVAKHLGVSADWVYDHQRHFAVVRVGRSLRFLDSSVERYIRTRAIARHG